MDKVDPVFLPDAVAGAPFVLPLPESVRRAVGLILVAVLVVLLLYGFFGQVLPGAAGLRGFGLLEAVEIPTMTTGGVLGVTTETSVSFVFCFVAFGVVHRAIGGRALFVDLAARLAGTARGDAGDHRLPRRRAAAAAGLADGAGTAGNGAAGRAAGRALMMAHAPAHCFITDLRAEEFMV